MTSWQLGVLRFLGFFNDQCLKGAKEQLAGTTLSSGYRNICVGDALVEKSLQGRTSRGSNQVLFNRGTLTRTVNKENTWLKGHQGEMAAAAVGGGCSDPHGKVLRDSWWEVGGDSRVSGQSNTKGEVSSLKSNLKKSNRTL